VTTGANAKCPVKMSPPTNQHPVFFTGQMTFRLPNQQRQSTAGKTTVTTVIKLLVETVRMKKALGDTNTAL